jgi:hypothetical protein
MSKVISFRLSPENPRDAKALAILQDWQSQGFSTRHTLTEALLKLDAVNSPVPNDDALNDLSDQIKLLLENIEMGLPVLESVYRVSSKTELSDGFVSSIIKAAKLGLRPGS